MGFDGKQRVIGVHFIALEFEAISMLLSYLKPDAGPEFVAPCIGVCITIPILIRIDTGRATVPSVRRLVRQGGQIAVRLPIAGNGILHIAKIVESLQMISLIRLWSNRIAFCPKYIDEGHVP